METMHYEFKFKIPLDRVDFHEDFMVHGMFGMCKSLYPQKTNNLKTFLTDLGVMVQCGNKWANLTTAVQSVTFNGDVQFADPTVKGKTVLK